jgi:4-amino-4-deoxy-L-arabinose transferase-like glycosyltransferase
VNAWLVSVCSVALISALGCVLFFRLAVDFADGALLPALLATVTFAFGTTFFPFSTLLFDHNLTASLLVAAFYFLRVVKKGEPGAVHHRALFLAGLCAGLAAITNYIAAVVVLFLGVYALLADERTSPNWRRAIMYSLGVLPPFLLICWYGWVCFGSPFKLNTDFQNPLFKDPNGVLGMFGMPTGWSLSILLVSPFRGLFFFSPVLVMGAVGIVVWLIERKLVAEARLCLAIAAFFYIVTASFNCYH